MVDVIPSLALDCVDLEFQPEPDRMRVRARTRTQGRTGVEMEALTLAPIGVTVLAAGTEVAFRWLK